MIAENLLAADAFTPTVRQTAIMGVLAAAVLYAIWYSRRKLAGKKWPTFERTELDKVDDAGARKDLAKLVAQLDGLSRQIEARLDARCAALEQTIHHADQRIAALRTVMEAARAAGVQLESGGMVRGSPLSTPKPEVPGLSDTRTHRIYELADEGRTALQIAQELQQRIGEVELILNLRETAQHNTDRAA